MAGFDGGEGGGDVVSAEEEDVGGEVERGVEEGVEADEAAEADEEAELRREAAEWRDGQGAEEGPDRPVAGEVGDVVDGVGLLGEGAVAEELQQVGEGREEREVDDELEGDDGALGHGWLSD